MGNMLYYVNPPPALPWNDFQHIEIFGSLEGFYNEAVGGQVKVWPDRLEVETKEIANSYAHAHKEMAYTMPSLEWGKKRTLKAKVRLVATGSSTGILRFGMGAFKDQHWIGWEMTDGMLRAKCLTLDESTAVDIEYYGDIPFDLEEALEIRVFPTPRAEFYRGGMLVASIILNIPTGATKSERIFEIYVYNPTEGENKKIEVSMILFHQVP